MADDVGPVDDIFEVCRRSVEAHRQHPVVAQWYHAVREIELPMPGLGSGTFPVIEFHDGELGAVVWSDGPDTWGTGGWHPLAWSGSLPPDVIWARPVAYGLAFAAALDAVAALRREVAVPPRPWWQFWV